MVLPLLAAAGTPELGSRIGPCVTDYWNVWVVKLVNTAGAKLAELWRSSYMLSTKYDIIDGIRSLPNYPPSQ